MEEQKVVDAIQATLCIVDNFDKMEEPTVRADAACYARLLPELQKLEVHVRELLPTTQGMALHGLRLYESPNLPGRVLWVTGLGYAVSDETRRVVVIFENPATIALSFPLETCEQRFEDRIAEISRAAEELVTEHLSRPTKAGR